MAPSQMKQWTVTSGDKGFDGLVYQDVPVPEVRDNEVLVRLRAASLNYRDLVIPKGQYPFPLDLPVAAASDGAGEVVSVGRSVTRWKAGDRVVTLFNTGHQYGALDTRSAATGLGGVYDGTLRQYGAFAETALVRAPAHASWEEAATLTCAGVTSWNALYGLRQLRPGQWVLVQGTGGVSIFALQIAKAAGARVVATTSSAHKGEALTRLGADHVINYRDDAAWGETARRLTPGGEGFHHVIEVGGPGTMNQSIKAIRYDGVITIIGFLGGVKAEDTPSTLDCLTHVCTVRGVYVGSREQMEDFVAALEAGDIHPVVDETVFTLEQAKEAYEYMWAQKHFGKVVIRID